MKTKLLRKIRRKALRIFNSELTVFETTNGEVTRLKHTSSYKWAFEWMFFQRLDYTKDMNKIVCKIARLLWKREENEFWKNKLRKKGGES